MPDWLKGYTLVLFGAFLWGTLAIISKESVVHPLTYATLRAGIAAVSCIAWFGLFAPATLRITSRHLLPLFLYGGASSALLYGGFMVALRRLSVGAAEVIFYTFPLLTTLSGSLILKERPTVAQILSGVIILLGVMCMALLENPTKWLSNQELFVGVLACFLAVIGMTVQSLVARWNSKTLWLPPWTLFCWGQFFAFVWLASYKQLTTGWTDVAALSSSSWLLVLYFGIVVTFWGYGAYNQGLQYVSASTGSLLAAFELITAFLLAIFFLDAAPTVGEALGCALILLALVINAREASKQTGRSG